MTGEVGRPRRGGRFDWSELHDVLDALPRGRWTSYGDLAELVGTAPRAVGTHLGRCPECTNAWRVVGSDGRARCPGPWGGRSGPRTQADLLRDEGVGFGGADGDVADPTKRLTPAELAGLTAGPAHRSVER